MGLSDDLRAGFGDNPLLTHTLRKQNLTEYIIYLMCTSVQHVLALEINLCTPKMLCQSLGVIELCWSTGKLFELVCKLILKVRI